MLNLCLYIALLCLGQRQTQDQLIQVCASRVSLGMSANWTVHMYCIYASDIRTYWYKEITKIPVIDQCNFKCYFYSVMYTDANMQRQADWMWSTDKNMHQQSVWKDHVVHICVASLCGWSIPYHCVREHVSILIGQSQSICYIFYSLYYSLFEEQ